MAVASCWLWPRLQVAVECGSHNVEGATAVVDVVCCHSGVVGRGLWS